MNAHDASTANTNNAARALKPVDCPSGVAPAADAFKALEAEYAKLPNDRLTAINVDIPRAVAVVLGAEPRLRSLLPGMEATLKSPPTVLVESIRQMALGAWYAHLVTMRARADGSVKELLERGTVLRAKLLKAADALADAGSSTAPPSSASARAPATSTRQTISSRSRRCSARAGTRSTTRRQSRASRSTRRRCSVPGSSWRSPRTRSRSRTTRTTAPARVHAARPLLRRDPPRGRLRALGRSRRRRLRAFALHEVAQAARERSRAHRGRDGRRGRGS